jgi:hypothetical protein
MGDIDLEKEIAMLLAASLVSVFLVKEAVKV